MIITIIAVAILNCDQRLWVPLLGMIPPFTCVLSSELDMQIDIGSLGYINCSKLSSLTELGSRAPLNSHLGGTLYKFRC